MRPLYGMAWGWALAVLAVSAVPAHAAWNNVFQVCCNHCGGSSPAPVVAAYGSCDPCPPACPPTTTCTTRYVQRSFYQPVTTYRTSYYYEPVTTYRTSYYYEPVTSYRYSCYYDPCTCSYQTVACPTTSYRLRSRCCPVTSYLQRTCMTPVTTYQQSFYYEPVTTCCTTSSGAAVTSPPAGSTVVPAAPNTSESRETAPANPLPAPPGTTESRDPGTTTSDYPSADRTPSLTPRPSMPPATGAVRPPTPRTPVLRLDRIASQGRDNLQGKVIQGDHRPRSGARILLVSADANTRQHVVTADREGAFRATIPAGGWLVYTHDHRGQPVFSRRIEVPADRTFSLTVMQR